MYEEQFSDWVGWTDRGSILNINNPGVYVIAHTEQDLSGSVFTWKKEIVYVGMTNAHSGLKGRLAAFDDTLSGKRISHGGADRVRYAHPDYNVFIENVYVAIASFFCDTRSKKPEDLSVMGEVARFEYLSWAEYIRHHGDLPHFNNRLSKKFSKAYKA